MKALTWASRSFLRAWTVALAWRAMCSKDGTCEYLASTCADDKW
jgi:hypothetical protein